MAGDFAQPDARRPSSVVRRRDRQRADGDARRAGGAAFPMIVPARPPRDAMATPE